MPSVAISITVPSFSITITAPAVVAVIETVTVLPSFTPVFTVLAMVALTIPAPFTAFTGTLPVPVPLSIVPTAPVTLPVLVLIALPASVSGTGGPLLVRLHVLLGRAGVADALVGRRGPRGAGADLGGRVVLGHGVGWGAARRFPVGGGGGGGFGSGRA